MCLLTVFPPGVQPNCEHLQCGAERNDMGHGFAILANDGQIITAHSMNGAELVDQFARVRAIHSDGPALFHSRITTAGVTTLYNCHPFQVNAQTVMAHNGIMPDRFQPPKGDIRSDTRIVAEDYLRRVAPLNSEKRRRRFARLITSYNKVAIITTDPAYKGRNLIIINEKSGSWDDGIWYSNDSYLPRPRYTSYASSSWGGYFECQKCGLRAVLCECPWGTRRLEWVDGPATLGHSSSDDCATCGASMAPGRTLCDWCNCCQTCLEHYKDCVCSWDDEAPSSAVIESLAGWPQPSTGTATTDLERYVPSGAYESAPVNAPKPFKGGGDVGETFETTFRGQRWRYERTDSGYYVPRPVTEELAR